MLYWTRPELRDEIYRLRAELELTRKLGTNLYVKSLNWKCSGHYKDESKAWADYINNVSRIQKPDAS